MSRSTFTVLDPKQPRAAVDRPVQQITAELETSIRAATPRRTGALAAGWTTVRRRPATYVISNDVPYAKYVEFGTSDTPAQPMVGPALAAARARYGR